MQLKYYVIYIVALSLGIGWKHLLHCYPFLVQIVIPWILSSSGLCSCLALL
jgi:hypothetical protein